MIKTPLSTMIGGAFWTPGAMILGGTSKTFNQIIQSLFTNNEQGFFYDPNDLTTMFQDAAGTVPVTGAGQPVGLVLDKSRGLQRGNELVVNGSFDVTGGWNNTGGFTIAGGKLLSNATTNNLINRTDFSAVLGKRYEVTVNISSYTRGVPRVSFGGNLVDIPALSGIHTYFVTATANTSILSIYAGYNGAGGVWEMDYISIKELAGNHAYQTNAASRPLLQRNATTGAYYLAFDGSDDFLVTNNIDFTATDKVSLFAGVRNLSDVAGMICELSNTIASNAGSFTLVSGTNAGGTGYNSSSRGSAAAAGSLAAKAFTYTSPESAVLSASHSISGSLSRICRNGVYGVDGVGNKGTGNFGNYPLYIGRRGGTSIPFNGHLYSLIGVARLSTDTETTAVEKAIAKNVGVTL